MSHKLFSKQSRDPRDRLSKKPQDQLEKINRGTFRLGTGPREACTGAKRLCDGK